MGRTELHTFEYACDGWLVDGRRCIETRRVEAESPEAADRTISTQEPWSIEEPWTSDHRGWLCTREHRAGVTRDEAIAHIWGLSQSVAGEFCVGRDETDELEQETRDALSALGVNSA